MRLKQETYLLQAAIVVGSLVPLFTGASGILTGPDFLRGVPAPAPPDLDSHVRYLSGLLFGIGIAFLTCIPKVQNMGARFQMLGGIVVLGGAGRLLSLAQVGSPGTPHLWALGMELIVVPLLLLWQVRIARRWRSRDAVRAEAHSRRAKARSERRLRVAEPQPGDPVDMASDRK